jgi:hypothetical protein
MVLHALALGKYAFPATTGRTLIGVKPNGRKHFADVVATDSQGAKILVSLKWQQSGGTAEEKVPFEVICLIDRLVKDPSFARAYLVLGGEGWTLREWYVGGGLDGFIPAAKNVRIVTLEAFVALANKGKL